MAQEYKAEDMVALLKSSPPPWQLGGDLPMFAQGLADMLERIQALEEWRKSMQSPPAEVPHEP